MTQDELFRQLAAELQRFCELSPKEWGAMQREPLCLSMWADQYTWEVGGMLNEWINSDFQPVNCANLSAFLTRQLVEAGVQVKVSTYPHDRLILMRVETPSRWDEFIRVEGTSPQHVLLATLRAYNAWREWQEQNNG